MTKIKKKSASVNERNTQKIQLNQTSEESNGPSKTESVSLPISALGMPETKNTQETLSTEVVETEIQRSASVPYSKILEREELGSMQLLGNTAKQLHGLMTGLIDSKKQNEFQRIHSGDINDVCNLANNISKLMKVKVDAIKTASKILRERK